MWANIIIGRKRFMTVDTLGLVLRVWVTAASVAEREGAKQVLKQVKQLGKGGARLHTIWAECLRGRIPPQNPLADGGFDGNPFLIWVMDVCRWIVRVVLRPE